MTEHSAGRFGRSRLCQQLAKAIHEKDAAACAAIVDFLRFRLGWNYDRTYALALEVSGVELAEWDALLYEADVTGE